jgi:hypothetical protein
MQADDAGHYSQTELAGFLELSEGAVHKRLHDARIKTRGLFERWLRAGQSPNRATAPSLWSTTMTRTAPDADGRSPQEKIDAMHRPRWCVTSNDGRLYWDLIYATIRNDTDTLSQHLDRDADCARLELWYTPPIHIAVDRGHATVAEFLRGAIGAAAATADLRLHEAVEVGDATEVTRLLQEVRGIGVRRDPQGLTALHTAVIAGDVELVHALLAGQVEIDAV